MADSAEFDVIMRGVDEGVTDMTDSAANALRDYNETLADLARQEAANQKLKEAKEDFENLTQAQKDALVAASDYQAEMDNLHDEANRMNEEFDKQPGIVDNAKNALTELQSGIMIVKEAYAALGQAYDATIAKTLEYAQQVRDLQAVSGQSAENTSRFIQVLDDYQISADDALAATKALTKQGYTPTTDTLADLSEKYLSLNSVQERNEFLTKNLGKAGLEWVNVLKQGPEAIRANAAAVSNALILNQKTLDQAEQLRLAQDQLNDTWQGLSITVGSGAIPAFSAWVTVIDKMVNGTEDAKGTLNTLAIPILNIVNLTKLYGDTYNELAAKAGNAAQGQKELNDVVEPTPEELQAAAQAAQALSAEYTNIISVTQTIQGAFDTMGTSIKGLRDEQAQLQSQLAGTPIWETDKIAEYKEKLAEIPAKVNEVQAQYHEAMSKLAFDNLMAKESVGGLTDAEFAQAQQAGVALGIFTQQSADQAIALNNLTTALANGKISTDEFKQAVDDGSFVVKGATDKNTAAFDDQSKTISEKNDESKASIDAYNQKMADSQKVTKDVTEQNASAFNTWGDSVASVFDSLIQYIADYNTAIAGLQSPPAIPPSGSSGESAALGANRTSSSGSGGGVLSVNIFLNGEYAQTQMVPLT